MPTGFRQSHWTKTAGGSIMLAVGAGLSPTVSTTMSRWVRASSCGTTTKGSS